MANSNGYNGISLSDLETKYPMVNDGETLQQYAQRESKLPSQVILAEWALHRDLTKATPAQIEAMQLASLPDDPFVAYFTAKAWEDENHKEIANSVASMVLSIFNKASDFLQPFLDEIPGAGEAFSLASKGLNALSQTWGINPDESNKAIADRIVYATIVAQHTAIAVENSMKKTMAPAQFQAFINSFKNKPIPGAGIKLKPLKSYRINPL